MESFPDVEDIQEVRDILDRATIAAVLSGHAGARRLTDCWKHPSPMDPPTNPRPPDDGRAGWYPLNNQRPHPPRYHFVKWFQLDFHGRLSIVTTACGVRADSRRLGAETPLVQGAVITAIVCEKCRGKRHGLNPVS